MRRAPINSWKATVSDIIHTIQVNDRKNGAPIKNELQVCRLEHKIYQTKITQHDTVGSVLDGYVDTCKKSVVVDLIKIKHGFNGGLEENFMRINTIW